VNTNKHLTVRDVCILLLPAFQDACLEMKFSQCNVIYIYDDYIEYVTFHGVFLVCAKIELVFMPKRTCRL
jgi:hypothetical protein